MTGPTLRKVQSLAQMAIDAGQGGSTDREIQALRDALEVALAALGLPMPAEDRDDICPECGGEDTTSPDRYGFRDCHECGSGFYVEVSS